MAPIFRPPRIAIPDVLFGIEGVGVWTGRARFDGGNLHRWPRAKPPFAGLDATAASQEDHSNYDQHGSQCGGLAPREPQARFSSSSRILEVRFLARSTPSEAFNLTRWNHAGEAGR